MTTSVNRQAMSLTLSGCLLNMLLLIPSVTQAQKETDFNMSTLMSSKLKLEAGIAFYKTLYSFEKGDRVASVGAGPGVREVIYSMTADSLTLYIQDIDTASWKSKLITQLAIRQYDLAERPVTATFRLIVGTGSLKRAYSKQRSTRSFWNIVCMSLPNRCRCLPTYEQS